MDEIEYYGKIHDEVVKRLNIDYAWELVASDDPTKRDYYVKAYALSALCSIVAASSGRIDSDRFTPEIQRNIEVAITAYLISFAAEVGKSALASHGIALD